MTEDTIEVPEELDAMLQPGQRLRRAPTKVEPAGHVWHVVAIVDDDYVVYKEWGWRKQRWFYRVEHMYKFYLLYTDGRLTRA